MTEAVIWRKIAAISDWISASVLSGADGAAAAVFSWLDAEGVVVDGLEDLEDLVLGGGCEICTCDVFQYESMYVLKSRIIFEDWLTLNSHRSTCSPVSLSVMTMTNFEILPPTIHLSSCDMIFLMYALTWSSDDTTKRRLAKVLSRIPAVLGEWCCGM